MRMLLALALAVSGCTGFSDRAPGCVAPPNETALLDVLAAEPALGVVPPAVAKQQRWRTEACHRKGEHVSTTVVSVHFELSRDLGRQEVQALYEPLALGSGWKPMPVLSDERHLNYCRGIEGYRSLLMVAWQDAYTVELPGDDEHVAARIDVAVHLSATEAVAEIEAGLQAAGC